MKNTIILLALFLSINFIYGQNRNIQWQKTIGGSGDDNLNSIIQTTDGGFLLGGFSDSNISGEKSEDSKGGKDYWIVKVDGTGGILWQKTYGGSNDDFLSSILQTSDGGFIIGGVSYSDVSGDKTENSQGDSDYWILKLDTSGNILWQNTIGGSEADLLASIVETNNGGYLVVGDSRSDISGDRSVVQNGNFGDIWVLRLNSSGTIDWQKAFYGAILHDVSGLAKTNDEGFIISSQIKITNSNEDYWILKIDASGNQIWDKVIEANNLDWVPKIKVSSDGGYILAGTSNSDASGDKTEDAINGSFDYWVIKLDETGNIIWENTIGGDSSEGNVNAISQCEDGGYLIQGYSDSNLSGDKTENSNGMSDFWFVKINNVGLIEWQNTIGGAATDIGGNAIQTSDGDFLTGGSSNSNISGDKSENSRGGFDYWIINHDSTLGLQENTFANAISIYPNPANNTLQLNTQDKTINQINIYALTGSKVVQLDVDTVSPTVDVSNLASGVYFIQLYSGKNVALKKFVKE